MADNLRFDLSGMIAGLTAGPNTIDAAVRLYAEQGALKLQNFARENRRWTDRTGHAKQRLTSYVGKISNGYRITLAHGVDYGLWLELANEKKYSIIPQALEYVGTFEIMPGFQKLLTRLG
jgi:hypothetical protein